MQEERKNIMLFPSLIQDKTRLEEMHLLSCTAAKNGVRASDYYELISDEMVDFIELMVPAGADAGVEMDELAEAIDAKVTVRQSRRDKEPAYIQDQKRYAQGHRGVAGADHSWRDELQQDHADTHTVAYKAKGRRSRAVKGGMTIVKKDLTLFTVACPNRKLI
jgi:hypothetical protein